jgi:hypothetical protein
MVAAREFDRRCDSGEQVLYGRGVAGKWKWMFGCVDWYDAVPKPFTKKWNKPEPLNSRAPDSIRFWQWANTPRIRPRQRALARNSPSRGQRWYLYRLGEVLSLPLPASIVVYLIFSLRNGVQPARCAHVNHAPQPTPSRPLESMHARWLQLIANAP